MKMCNLRTLLGLAIILCTCICGVPDAYGATLRLSPDTGVYTAGGTFSASVLINTEGKSINAADAELTFNPRELSVVSVSKGSLFNLWTLDPTFSNGAGTISFGGGSPQGYAGKNGTIMTITFRAVAAGTPKVSFKSGSVLAADGLGTNVLTTMAGGSYTIQAQSETPPPEYVPPPSTPAAPVVESASHPDATAWYPLRTATVAWKLPSDVTAVRTALDRVPTSVPTKVYDPPIRERELTDLEEGTSYFHIQFKNDDGWGRVTHVPLNIDATPPAGLSVSEAEGVDETSTVRTLHFSYTDTSPVRRYTIQIDGEEPIAYTDSEETKAFTTPALHPGRHTVVVEAFDSAGNSSVAHYSFVVGTFEAPVFADYPTRVNAGVIPALRGTSRPNATIEVVVRTGDTTIMTETTTSDASGTFTFIPSTKLPIGVYDISAVARTENGGVSESSVPIRMIVDEPGYLKLGSLVLSVLSVIVPLVGLLFLLVFGSSFLYYRYRRFKRSALRETRDAEDKLRREFDAVLEKLHIHIAELEKARKSKITKAEAAFIDAMRGDLGIARSKIERELKDIEDVVQ